MTIDYAHISEIGSRKVNEDSCSVATNDKGALFAVADGLGGHGKGEVASQIVTETLKGRFMSADSFADTFLPDAFAEAQESVISAQNEKNELRDMKSTCAALLITDDVCCTAHIGDTRVYTFYKNKVKTRTLDHSVPQMLVMSGEIKDKQIRNHPDRNRLVHVIGTAWESPQCEISGSFPISECQAFLLCSDGFWELISEKQMCNLLKKHTHATGWLSAMTCVVIKNGSGRDMDNFTAIAVLLDS